MKKYLYDYFLITVNHISSLLLGFLVAFILLIPVRMITSDVSTRNMLHLIIQDIATYIVLIVIYKKLGFSWNTPQTKLLPYSFIILSLFAAFTNFLLVIISNFEFILLYFNTAFVIDMLYAEETLSGISGIGIELMKTTYRPQVILYLLLHTISYIPFMLAGYYWGSKSRIKERQNLTATKIDN